MSQPIPLREPFSPAERALAALGVERCTLPVELYDNGPRYVLLEVATPLEVAALQPDLTRLASLGNLAFVVFARSGARWKVRVFAPGEGIPEDPGTGAAAGALVVHLCRHGRVQPGDQIVIDQGAEIARPSTLYARATGAREQIERVEVGGGVVLVATGQLRVA